MINGMYHAEIGALVIDAAEIKPGLYEIMVLKNMQGEEIECHTTNNINEAEGIWMDLVSKYENGISKPLTGKYAKLRDDLRIALKAGRSAEDANPEDGGTCNFDSAALKLPRWKEAMVKQAAKEAGTGAFKWHNGWFVFGPNTSGQANARSRNAEAMTKSLDSLGYEAFEYCQMD